ncbi:MAG TPA: ribosome-associated translation inhibitor RaiA [Patescibacteria group bacterium]|nr:ribosome-associated translation inhibitor RaiA [Patescibacteria group bacterium]
MRVNIKATNIELTTALRSYIVEKMNMLEKYLGNTVKVLHLDFEVEKTITNQNTGEIFRAEANMEVPGNMLRVEKTEHDLYKAIDKVKDHMEIVIKRHKDKLEDKKRGKI